MPILFSGLHSPPPTRPPTLLCSSTWQRELPCILRLPLWRTLHVASVIPNSTFRFYSQLLNISWNCKRSFFLDEFRPDFFFLCLRTGESLAWRHCGFGLSQFLWTSHVRKCIQMMVVIKCQRSRSLRLHITQELISKVFRMHFRSAEFNIQKVKGRLHWQLMMLWSLVFIFCVLKS